MISGNSRWEGALGLSFNSFILGNYIGVDPSGTFSVPNGKQRSSRETPIITSSRAT